MLSEFASTVLFLGMLVAAFLAMRRYRDKNRGR